MSPPIHQLLLAMTVSGTLGLASVAEAASPRSVKFNLGAGTVGGLRLGSATKSQVVRTFGQPRREDDDRNLAGIRTLLYSCGIDCTLRLQIKGNRLVLGWALQLPSARAKRRIRTVAGSYLGAPRFFAERREGASMTSTCDTGLSKSRGRFSLRVAATSSRVDSIILQTTGGAVLC